MKVSEMKLFYILFFCLPMVACRYGADIRNELSRAETLLQDAPDSALNILQSIKPDKIRKDRIRAEYALLYSMALDKNYIMVESDSLIRIARNFYHDSGDICPTTTMGWSCTTGRNMPRPSCIFSPRKTTV